MRKRIVTLTIFLFCLPAFGIYNPLLAQEIEWQKRYGGSADQFGYYFSATSDGGFIVSATTNGNDSVVTGWHGNVDIWVFKTDSAGNMIWQKCLGGSDGDYGNNILQTPDGGYILLAATFSNDGDVTGFHGGTTDIWVVKLDAGGNIEWQRCYGGSSLEEPGSIVLADSGYVFTGATNSNDGDVTGYLGLGRDIWMVHIDQSGDIVWQLCLPQVNDDRAHSIIKLPGTGYIIAGDAYHWNPVCQGGVESKIIVVDSIGNILDEYCVGGPDDDMCWFSSPTSDGGIISIHTTGGNGGDVSGFHTGGGSTDIWVVRQDQSGVILWQRCIGGNGNEYATIIHEDQNGNFILTGRTTSANGDINQSLGNNDAFVAIIGSSGNLIQTSNFGGTGQDQASDMIATNDNKYYFIGATNSSDGDLNPGSGGLDAWMVKFSDNQNYNLISGKTYFDLNSNAAYDSADAALRFHVLTEVNSGIHSLSASNGNYGFALFDTGSYSIVPNSFNSFYNPTPVFHAGAFTTTGGLDSLKDFAFQPAGNFNDLCVTITPLGVFRSGMPAHYSINYINNGTTTLNPVIIFYPDADVTFQSANPTPSAVTPDSVVWNFGPMASFQNGSILITVDVNSGLPIGTLVNSGAAIEPLAGDVNPGCNFSYWEVFIVGSLDPNDIIVNRDSIFDFELSSPPYLEYIIRFQNTGNDTAFYVRVGNNLPGELDLNTFEVIASSHPMDLAYSAYSRLMEFTFNNILLPDSNINEPGSHGFLRYRIKPLSSLVVGDSIKNHAAIYFDFNQPVLTNVAVTEIVMPVGISQQSAVDRQPLNVYPNPVQDEITVVIENVKGKQVIVWIYDVYGRPVKMIYDGRSAIDVMTIKTRLDELPGGIYFVRMDVGSGIECRKIVKY